jgi:regulator of replication initiation timing
MTRFFEALTMTKIWWNVMKMEQQVEELLKEKKCLEAKLEAAERERDDLRAEVERLTEQRSELVEAIECASAASRSDIMWESFDRVKVGIPQIMSVLVNRAYSIFGSKKRK